MRETMCDNGVASRFVLIACIFHPEEQMDGSVNYHLRRYRNVGTYFHRPLDMAFPHLKR